MTEKPVKIAIVTGGGHGIGLATAHLLFAHGYGVSVWDTDKERLSDLPQQFNGNKSRLLALACDVAEEEAVKRAVAQTLDHFGRLDLLVNNAGVMDEKPLAEVSLADWNRILGINLTGAFLSAKYGAEALGEQGGRIINIASTRAFQSEPNTFAYSATKGALVALTHALAVSLGPAIRVNCISPGWIDVSGKPEALRPQDHAQHPAGRVGHPDDIARMVLFLAEDANSFITGQNFVVDGGMSKKMIYLE